MKKVAIVSSGKFLTVNNIFCVGRNYAAHAAELNNPIPQAPIIFLKPTSSVIYNGDTIILPPQSQEVHHEVEVVVLIGKKGKNIASKDALEHVAGYGIGLDITARDIQQAAKEKSHPWTVAKGFDTFAPISDFLAASEFSDPQALSFSLKVNNEVRQEGNTALMLFSIADLIAYLSTIFTLNPGDIIFTGTPKGVSKLEDGDRLIATLEKDLLTLQVDVKRDVANL